MELLQMIIELGPLFIILLLIFLFCIFIAPLMCWSHCASINKKLDKIITLLSSVNDSTTLNLINTNEELKEKIIEEMQDK